jgi:hypothetical protein
MYQNLNLLLLHTTTTTPTTQSWLSNKQRQRYET